MIMRITKWYGKQLIDRERRAAARGIDQTTHACVLLAQEMAPRDTGFMANTMEAWAAVQESDRVVGTWGNATADYTLWVEIGANGRPGVFFMRRAADAEYSNLDERVGAAFRSMG